MSYAEQQSNARRHTSGLAPYWHTAALIALILLVAALGSLWLRSPASPPFPAVGARIGAIYLPILCAQWGILLYVTRVGRAGSALSSLLGERWREGGRAATDLALAFACALAIETIHIVWNRLGAGGASVSSILPVTFAEQLTWVIVAVSVGWCEEITYRGYLRVQLTAFTKSAGAGTVLQAVLFGVAHLEQGVLAALRITLYGLLLGALAQLRRSLLPGIACHIGLDLASGLLR